ncbi:MAG: 1-acyl-sn-glycerol-3-phosphate acyltransferase [Nannocystaceae bacterium]|nr:1-acyl-sn-glycerol-3-phosphate acyltransferase [Myxococcales bacterium]
MPAFTLNHLTAFRIDTRPIMQRLIAHGVLRPNYGLLPGVDIQVEGLDRIPDEPVVFVMNHTDRFNYWPFQYKLYRARNRFTATWVKPKNAEFWFIRWMYARVNAIPMASRGYLITRDFLDTVGRKPSPAEYEVLRDMVDKARLGDDDAVEEAEDRAHDQVPAVIFTRARDMLGRIFSPEYERYATAQCALFARMMDHALTLHDDVEAKGVDLLIFPQGTRSVRLSRGHAGAAQVILHGERPVVPVGCSGSDHVYPGNSPFARRGRIIYRLGEPLRPTEDPALRINEPFRPFSPATEARHGDRFRALTDLIMDRINELVDPPYQFSEDRESEGVRGNSRFL